MKVTGGSCPASVAWRKTVVDRSSSSGSSGVEVMVVERERRLWEDLFVNASEWWDNRAEKRSPQHPDFRHKIIKAPLWLSSTCKPSWVDSRLPGLYLLHGPDSPDSMSRHLQSLCEQGDLDKVVDTLLHLQDGSLRSHRIYWSLVQECNHRKSLKHAQEVFHHIVNLGLEPFSLVGEYLVGTLAKCGDVEAALRAFHMLPFRSTFSWTAVISIYLDLGDPQAALEMYQLMQDERVNPSERTFVAVIQACGNALDIEKGRAAHKYAQEVGLDKNSFVGCTLISMYGKCGSVREALSAFEGMPTRCVVSWTAMLSAFLEQGEEGSALEFYNLMQKEGVSPNDRTIVVALQACGELAEKECLVWGEFRSMMMEAYNIGQALHSFARRKGYHLDVFVGSTLISMYGKCRRIEKAENVFSGMVLRNIVSWNALLSAYVDCGLEKKALQLYVHLQGQHYVPNKRTYAIVAQACCVLAEKEEAHTVNRQSIKCMSLDIVSAVHADAGSRGFETDVFVGGVLVCAYGKCGNVAEAENVFRKLHNHDAIVWTGLLFVYVEQGEARKALEVYTQMQEKGAMLDDVALVCALQACADSGNLIVCEQIHFAILLARCILGDALALNLIHTYGGCMSIMHAQAVFDGLSYSNVVLWTALMDGYTQEGKYRESLRKFEEMKLGGTNPDGVTFLLALSACGHLGLVDKGLEYFESMYKVYRVVPEIKHFVSVVDLLGRVGDFSKLEGLVSRMSTEPNMALWLCLLDACRTYGNVAVGNWAFEHAMKLNSEEAAAYALMSNIYANAGLWDSVSYLETMKRRLFCIDQGVEKDER